MFRPCLNKSLLINIHRLHSKDNFISRLIRNTKDEFSKSKELKENLKKFRHEANKLDNSEALKMAREKYKSIEKSEKVGRMVGQIQSSLNESIKRIQENEMLNEIVKKGKDNIDLGKASEYISKQKDSIEKSKPYQSFAEAARVIDQEITKQHSIYKSPPKLTKRSELLRKGGIKADEDTSGVVVHKDSLWSESWQKMKENNVYINKMFGLKARYDESDHIAARFTRHVTNRVTDIFGGMFSGSKMSVVLTEVAKVDPTFEKDKFLDFCRSVMIPNILESIVKGDLEVLRDWCHQAPYGILTQMITGGQGHTLRGRILDICNVDLVDAKMVEQGPVLVISFSAQQIMAVIDKANKVVDGSLDQVQCYLHVWALCRNQSSLDPLTAWKLIDVSFMPSEQWI